MSIPHLKMWVAWGLITSVAAGWLGIVMTSPESTQRKRFLPGKTTHGHYQIELKCNACHTPDMGVTKNACNDCHAADLDGDTHPAKKFNDPSNAGRLALLDAQDCLTCHREHSPRQTGEMGVSLPLDYCWRCHQETLEQRPSHAGFSFRSCATAGCHNYHDNSALHEKFLFDHLDEPDVLAEPRVPLRTAIAELSDKSLTAAEHDCPADVSVDKKIQHDWAASAHARAGVNCTGCHTQQKDKAEADKWTDTVPLSVCGNCHEAEQEGFLAGHHGMRLAVDLSPMKPGMARQPMKSSAAHQELSCNSCHKPHQTDTTFAAVESCLSCHNDKHSLAYKESRHYQLWLDEQAGKAEAGSGVSCATCHLPRLKKYGKVSVQHNQNDNLRPNEKMVRSTCNHCHGVQFTLDALASRKVIDGCFVAPAKDQVDSLEMVRKWFHDREQARKKRQ